MNFKIHSTLNNSIRINIILPIIIIFLIFSSFFYGTLNIKSLSASTNQNNYLRLKRYLTITQPNNIKSNIRNTVNKYKSQKKKRTPLSESQLAAELNQYYKKFNIRLDKTSPYFDLIDAMRATEDYLQLKISNQKPKGCNGYFYLHKYYKAVQPCND